MRSCRLMEHPREGDCPASLRAMDLSRPRAQGRSSRARTIATSSSRLGTVTPWRPPTQPSPCPVTWLCSTTAFPAMPRGPATPPKPSRTFSRHGWGARGHVCPRLDAVRHSRHRIRPQLLARRVYRCSSSMSTRTRWCWSFCRTFRPTGRSPMQVRVGGHSPVPLSIAGTSRRRPICPPAVLSSRDACTPVPSREEQRFFAIAGLDARVLEDGFVSVDISHPSGDVESVTIGRCAREEEGGYVTP